MSRSVRSVALILGSASFMLTAAPVLAAPSQVQGPTPISAGNNQTLVVTFEAVLPQVLGGFESTDRAVMYLPNDRVPTLPAADQDADEVHDCLESPPILGARCFADTAFIGNERTQTTLTAQFAVTGAAPSDEWVFTSIDSGDADTWTCPSTEDEGCFTLTGAAPTVTAIAFPSGMTKSRGQGSGPMTFTVTGTNFTPGTVVAEATEQAGIEVSAVERLSATQLRATVTIGPDAPVIDNPLRLRNTAGDGAALDIDVVAGPAITSFTPASRGRGANGTVVAIAGSNFVPGSTTFETAAGSGVTIASASVTNPTTASMTIGVSSTATAGNVAITAVEPTTGGRGSANFVVNPDSNIVSISPGGLRAPTATNPAAGQNKTVTLTGTDFREGLEVSISNLAKVAFDNAGRNLTVTPTQVSFNVDVQTGAVQGDQVTITLDPNDGGPTDSIVLAIVGTPSVTSYNPGSLGRGAVDAPLQIIGTNLDASATYAFSGSGLTVGPCAGSTTQIVCDTDVAPDAALTNRTLTITSAGEDPTVVNSPTLGVNAAPTITALTDTLGQGATDHPVEFDGTGYVTGATIASDGLTADACTASASGVDCVVDLAGDAATGPRTMTIINGDYGRPVCDATVCELTVNAAPTVSAIAPDEVARGAATELVVTGEHLAATTDLTLGNGITVAPGGTVNAEGTELTVSVTVANDAPLTGRRATVVNDDGGRSVSEPLLDVLAPPQLTSISPTHIGQGADDATIRVIGVGLSDVATVSFGTGVTTASVTPVGTDHTTLDVVVDVAADAPTGAAAHDAVVTNPDDSVATLVDALSVDPLPTITSIVPSSIGQGAQSWPIQVTGTGFLPGAILELGDGVLVDVESVTATTIDALVTVAGDAVVGERDAAVRNDNAGAPGTCAAATADCLTIAERPVLTSLDPNAVGAGAANVVLTATGTGIVPGASLDLGPSVVAVNHADVDATSVEVEIDIQHDAAVGAVDAVLINGDGGRSVPADDAFTILAPPTIDAISPRQLVPGANSITISGGGFESPADVSFGPGVTVTTTTVSSGGATLIVEATLANDATPGIRDVRVTNPNQGSVRCLGCLDVGDPTDAATITSRGYIGEGAIVRFFDRVRNVSSANLFIRLASGPVVSMRQSCFDLDGNVEPCATSTDIRRVELRPSGHLVPGERYVVVLNPSGVSPKVVSDRGDLPSTTGAFTASRSMQESSSAVDLLWQPIRDAKAVGGRYVRESRAGAAMAIPFVGDDVTWISPRGPSFGLARVAVDGVTVDESADASAEKNGYGRRFTFAGFGPGNHVLTITALGTKGADGTGTFVAVDGLVDDRGQILNPGGRSTWASRPEATVQSKRVAVASLPGQKAVMEFRGTGLRVDFVAAPDGGRVQVLIDGFRVANVDLYSAKKRLFKVSLSGLQDARHTVTLLVTGARNAASSGTVVRLDYFGVRG